MGNKLSSSSGSAGSSSARHSLQRGAAPVEMAAATPATDGTTTATTVERRPPGRGLSSSRSGRWLRPLGTSGRRLSTSTAAAATDGDGGAAIPSDDAVGSGNVDSSSNSGGRGGGGIGSSSSSSSSSNVSGFLRSRFASSGGGSARGLDRERSGVVGDTGERASGSGGTAAAATSSAGTGAATSHGSRFRTAFSVVSAGGGGSRRTRLATLVSRPPSGGMQQPRCPRCRARISIRAGMGSFQCPCGVHFRSVDAAPATITATGATTTATTPVSSHDSSTSSSPEFVFGQRRQRQHIQPQRHRRRAEQGSPTFITSTSAGTMASPVSTAAAVASTSSSTVPARSNHWPSPVAEATGILSERRGAGDEEAGGGRHVVVSAGAPDVPPATAAGGGDSSPPVAAAFPEFSRTARASTVGSGGTASTRWTSRLALAADGALGVSSSSIRPGGRGAGVNHLQVVMCSNCGRAGVIQSLDSFTSRSMFFCSCGNPVIPATPAQLLAALSRGAAAAATQQRGASNQLINLLPTMEFEEGSLKMMTSEIGKGLSQDDDKVSCRVCLCEYEGGDTLRILPCLHKFHQSCIDKWLGRSPLCPLCNTSVDVVYTDPLFSTDGQRTPVPS